MIVSSSFTTAASCSREVSNFKTSGMIMYDVKRAASKEQGRMTPLLETQNARTLSLLQLKDGCRDAKITSTLGRSHYINAPGRGLSRKGRKRRESRDPRRAVHKGSVQYIHCLQRVLVGIVRHRPGAWTRAP